MVRKMSEDAYEIYLEIISHELTDTIVGKDYIEDWESEALEKYAMGLIEVLRRLDTKLQVKSRGFKGVWIVRGGEATEVPGYYLSIVTEMDLARFKRLCMGYELDDSIVREMDLARRRILPLTRDRLEEILEEGNRRISDIDVYLVSDPGGRKISRYSLPEV